MTHRTEALVEALWLDLDVILFSEIRDRDSLDAAVKAALTGHLVIPAHAHEQRALNEVALMPLHACAYG